MATCPEVSGGVRDTTDTPVSGCPEVSPLKGGTHSGHFARPHKRAGVPSSSDTPTEKS